MQCVKVMEEDMRIGGMCAGTQRTLRLIGPPRTKLLLFTGRRLSGAEAVEWGLADVLSETPEEVHSQHNRLLIVDGVVPYPPHI